MLLKTITINKNVVLENNKQDIKYLSMTDKRLNELENHLKNGNDLYINIIEYKNIYNKTWNIIDSKKRIKVKELSKMGLRSRNKKDTSKNTYRIKYTIDKMENFNIDIEYKEVKELIDYVKEDKKIINKSNIILEKDNKQVLVMKYQEEII